MRVAGLQKLTLIDYPGKLACTVFTFGCNFRCPWCYSRELVLPEEIAKYEGLSEAEFLKFLKERQGLLEAVCFCGGEPTLQKDLAKLIKKVKQMGYLVKLDTNGSNPEALKDLFKKKLLDYVAMDIKATIGAQTQNSPARIGYAEGVAGGKLKCQSYDEAIGVKVDLDKIRQSIELIKNSGVDYEFRTTIVPGFHDKEVVLEIAKGLSPAKRYYLQSFRPEKTIDRSLEKMPPYSHEELLDILRAVAPFFEVCELRQ